MRRRRRFLVVGLLTLVAASAGSVTWAAFTATTQNDGSQVQAGSVSLGDNDNDASMMSMSGGLPGTTRNGCIKVTYNGSLPSGVRLYGTTTGTGLDQYLDLTVTRGTFNSPEPAFASCTNFQADGTNYIGAGQGVIYNGTLQAFPDTYATGIVDPVSGSPESWTAGEVHVYRFDVTVQSNIDGEGLTAMQEFAWEARNQ